jgi:hypothetical protein
MNQTKYRQLANAPDDTPAKRSAPQDMGQDQRRAGAAFQGRHGQAHFESDLVDGHSSDCDGNAGRGVSPQSGKPLVIFHHADLLHGGAEVKPPRQVLR